MISVVTTLPPRYLCNVTSSEDECWVSITATVVNTQDELMCLEPEPGNIACNYSPGVILRYFSDILSNSQERPNLYSHIKRGFING